MWGRVKYSRLISIEIFIFTEFQQFLNFQNLWFLFPTFLKDAEIREEMYVILGERPHEDIIKKYTECEHKGEYKGTDITA